MTPPKRLRRLPPGGAPKRPGGAGSAAAAWLAALRATRVIRCAKEG